MRDKAKILSLRIMNNEISMSKFEKELYLLNENSQLFEDLICLNFKSKYISHEVMKIIKSHIEKAEIEKYVVNELLNDIMVNNENAFQSFIRTYDLRCSGYWFFEEIGMYMALNIISCKDELITSIDQLPQNIQNDYHQIILPKAKLEAKRIQNLLLTKEIILTGETKELSNRKIWIDNRQEDFIDTKELETIKFHSQSTDRIRETKQKWLQGGPFLEISSIKTNFEDKSNLVEQELNYLKKWNEHFTITTDNPTFKKSIANYISGNLDEDIIHRNFSINCQIELAGKRKAIFEIVELSNELYSTNLYMYGSRIGAEEWNQLGISLNQEIEIISHIKPYIEISNPIVLSVGYEDDSISFFDTDKTYPHEEYRKSKLSPKNITNMVTSKINGYEYCYISGNDFNLMDKLEIRKTA